MSSVNLHRSSVSPALFLAAVAVAVSVLGGFPGSGLHGATEPAGVSAGPDVYYQSVEQGAYPFHRLFSKSAIVLYQRTISRTKGTSCPFTPHCSKYGLMAFERFNPIAALTITSDRLLRCAHDLSNYDVVVVDDHLRVSDPLPGGEESSSISLSADESDARLSQGASDEKLSARVPISYSDRGDSLLYTFARSLLASEDYERAITEFRRLIHYYPATDLRADAAVGLFDAYYLSSDYWASIRWGEAAIESFLGGDRIPRMKFRIGISYFRLGKYTRSRSYFTDSLVLADRSLRDRAVMLRGFSYAYKMNWSTAIDEFKQIDSASQIKPKAEHYEEVCREAMAVDYKSPTLASILGIVPGLGYLYDGYSGTALASFIVNSLFGWATYTAFDKDNDGLGVLLGVLTFGWYSGNIYGSIASAKRQNMRTNKMLILRFDAEQFF